jgi:hypothetical protein
VAIRFTNAGGDRRPRLALALVCALAATLTACGPTGHPWLPGPRTGPEAPSGLAPLDQVRQITLSPDRQRVAILEQTGRSFVLWLADVGGEPRRIGPVGTAGPIAWVGDGSAVAYLDVITEPIPGKFSDWNLPALKVLSRKLMTVSLDGATRVLDAAPPEHCYLKEAPKGPWIAYAAGMQGPLRLLNSDTGRHHTVAPKVSQYGFAWSTDGSKVAVTESNEPAEKYYRMIVYSRDGEVLKTVPQVYGQLMAWVRRDSAVAVVSEQDPLWATSFDATVHPLDETKSSSWVVHLPFTLRNNTTDRFVPSPDGSRWLVWGRNGERALISINDQTLLDWPFAGQYAFWLDNDRLIHGERWPLTIAPVPTATPALPAPSPVPSPSR